MQNIIDERKVTTAVSFGSENRIDHTLLRKIVERLNYKTSAVFNVIILDDIIISEPALNASKEKFFQFLNHEPTPISVSLATIDDSLFKNESVKSIIIRSLPKAIKDGAVKGTLEKDQFVPELYTLQLQKTQVTALEKNKVSEIIQFSKVGIKNVKEYLSGTIEAPFTVLEDYVILDSYISDIAKESEEIICSDGFVDINAVTLFGVSNESPDRSTILKSYIPILKSNLRDTVVDFVFLQEVDKKTRKNLLPNFIVTEELEKEIKDDLQANLAATSAKTDAQLVKQETLMELINDKDALEAEVFNVVPKFDEKKISAYLAKDFSRESKQLPSQLLRYYASKFGTQVRDTYQQKLLKNIYSRYNAEKVECLVLMLVNLIGIQSITDKKLSVKIYSDLQESIETQTSQQFRYLPRDVASEGMNELYDYLVSEVEKIQEPEFILTDALSERQKLIIDGLERALKKESSIDNAASVLHLATIIVHSKVLRFEEKYGSLNVTGKYTPKVLKCLGKMVDINEFHSLLSAIKNGEVTQELVDQTKAIALNM